jgi:hypothetical protein
MDSQIIVAGGEISHAQAVSDVTAYDPRLNSWKGLTLYLHHSIRVLPGT